MAIKLSLPVAKETINDETSALVAVSLPNDPGEDQRSDPPRDDGYRSVFVLHDIEGHEHERDR